MQLQFPKQIHTQQTENNDPQTQEYFPVKDPPTLHKVGIGEELQRQCKFQETQGDLHRIQPSAGLTQHIQLARKEGKQGKWKRQRHRKSKHAHQRTQITALGSQNQQIADDRTGAGK